MMPQLPLRVRLTLWYALAIAVALFSIGFISLWMVHRAIDDLENNELQQRVRSVRRFVETAPPAKPPHSYATKSPARLNPFTATNGSRSSTKMANGSIAPGMLQPSIRSWPCLNRFPPKAPTSPTRRSLFMSAPSSRPSVCAARVTQFRPG